MKKIVLLALFLFLFSSSLFAEEVEDKEEIAPLYAQFSVVSRMSANTTEKRSLLAKQLYVEKAVTDDGWAAWGMVYNDQEYQGLYAGVVRNVGNWQLALGTGSAQYGGTSHVIVNPWVFYSDTDTEAFVSAEHYSRESVNPWYYKGYVHKRALGDLFAGVYGEKDFGLGPMIDYNWAKGVKTWVAIPVACQPSSGRTKLLVGFSFEF